jgi:hypothetical protein
MLEFIMLGGVPSFVIITFSLLALTAAIFFVRRPDERYRHMIRAMTNVVLTSIALGTATAFFAVMRFAAAHANEAGLREILLQGTAEALTPAILGFAFLSAIYMLVAVAERRLRA